MELSFYINGPRSYAHVPFEESIPAVAAAGFTGIDISASAGAHATDSSGFDTQQRQRLASVAHANGIAIAAVVTHLGLCDSVVGGAPLDLVAAAEVAADVGSPIVTFHIGEVPAGHAREDAWRRTVTAVRSAIDASPTGVRIAVDAVSPGFLTRTLDEVAQFLDEVDRPRAAWNYDPAFVLAAGWDPAAAVHQLADWIVHAHVKDVTGRYPSMRWELPGEGDLDHAAYVRALRDIGFEGFLAAEVIAMPKGAPSERWPIAHAARRSASVMSAAIATAQAR
jgi:sugar phosphate isomerase/epimerase